MREQEFTRTATLPQPGPWHGSGVTTTLSRSSRMKRTAELNLRPSQHSLQPGNLDSAERTAVANGDLQWLRSSLAEGKLANHVRWSDGGLLTVAVRNNRQEVLAFLLDECKFDPDERVSGGEGDWVAYSQGHPLWNAAAMGLERDCKSAP